MNDTTRTASRDEKLACEILARFIGTDQSNSTRNYVPPVLESYIEKIISQPEFTGAYAHDGEGHFFDYHEEHEGYWRDYPEGQRGRERIEYEAMMDLGLYRRNPHFDVEGTELEGYLRHPAWGRYYDDRNIVAAVTRLAELVVSERIYAERAERDYSDAYEAGTRSVAVDRALGTGGFRPRSTDDAGAHNGHLTEHLIRLPALLSRCYAPGRWRYAVEQYIEHVDQSDVDVSHPPHR